MLKLSEWRIPMPALFRSTRDPSDSIRISALSTLLVCFSVLVMSLLLPVADLAADLPIMNLVVLAGIITLVWTIDRKLLIVSDLRHYGSLAVALAQAKLFVRMRKLVPDMFEDAVRAWPKKVCMQFEDRAMTFAEADALANRAANWALSLGLKPGDTVALLMENCPEYVAIWLGLSKVGVVSALLNTNLQATGLVHCLKVAGSTHLIVGHELAKKIPEILELLPETQVHVFAHKQPASFNDELEKMSASGPPASLRREANITSGNMCLLIYTSGTTGLPKAARVSHFSITLRALALRHDMHLGKHDRIYCALPLYHTSGGNLAVGMMLSSGATLCISRRFSTSRFWDEVRKFDCTVVHYIGEMCRYLLNAPAKANDKDNRVRAAFGNGLRPDVWATFQSRFGIPAVYEFYGSTEGVLGMVNSCTSKADQGHLGKRGFFVNHITGTRIIKYDVELDEHIRDSRGFLQDVDVNEPGELIYRINPKDTARSFQGYYKNEAESKKKVLTDVFTKGDTYFRTGDLLKIDENSCWHFVDRVGDTFRWKGENVSTNEVAEAITKFPGLSDVCVYGVEVPGAEGRACMAAMVFEDADAFDMKGFAVFVKKQLPSYAMPLFLRALPEMSVTGTMKHEKAKLRKQGADPSEVVDRMWGYDKSADTYVPLTVDLYRSHGSSMTTASNS